MNIKYTFFIAVVGTLLMKVPLTASTRSGTIAERLAQLPAASGAPVTQTSAVTKINTQKQLNADFLQAVKSKAPIEHIASLLEQGADIETVDETNGFSAIHYCAALGSLDTIKVLILHGINFEKTDTSGVTPICFAAVKGNAAVVRALIEAGAKNWDIDFLLMLISARHNADDHIPYTACLAALLNSPKKLSQDTIEKIYTQEKTYPHLCELVHLKDYWSALDLLIAIDHEGVEGIDNGICRKLLCHMALLGASKRVAELLDAQVSLNGRCGGTLCPLECAVLGQDPKTIDLLINHERTRDRHKEAAYTLAKQLKDYPNQGKLMTLKSLTVQAIRENAQ